MPISVRDIGVLPAVSRGARRGALSVRRPFTGVLWGLNVDERSPNVELSYLLWRPVLFSQQHGTETGNKRVRERPGQLRTRTTGRLEWLPRFSTSRVWTETTRDTPGHIIRAVNEAHEGRPEPLQRDQHLRREEATTIHRTERRVIDLLGRDSAERVTDDVTRNAPDGRNRVHDQTVDEFRPVSRPTGVQNRSTLLTSRHPLIDRKRREPGTWFGSVPAAGAWPRPRKSVDNRDVDVEDGEPLTPVRPGSVSGRERPGETQMTYIKNGPVGGVTGDQNEPVTAGRTGPGRAIEHGSGQSQKDERPRGWVVSPVETRSLMELASGPDLDRLVDRVYAEFERKLRIERERRGR